MTSLNCTFSQILAYCSEYFLHQIRYHWPKKEVNEENKNGVMLEKDQYYAKRNSVSYMSDELGLHRVENTSHSDGAVSLHLYSPPFQSCQVPMYATLQKKLNQYHHVLLPNHSTLLLPTEGLQLVAVMNLKRICNVVIEVYCDLAARHDDSISPIFFLLNFMYIFRICILYLLAFLLNSYRSTQRREIGICIQSHRTPKSQWGKI